MKSIMYTYSNTDKFYDDDSFLGKIKDRFKIRISEEFFIKELKLKIKSVKFPSNININSYNINISRAKKICKIKDIELAPKVYRYLDYTLYNKFQKKLMAFGIVESSKIILRNKKKSIRCSCIAVYDAADPILFDTICYLSGEAKYIILISKNIAKLNNIRKYIISNYGVTPIITSDIKFSFKSADFIITSRRINIDNKKYVWYIDNSYIPQDSYNVVNDISYKIPWEFKYGEISFELLGSMLSQMDEQDVKKSLNYNGVFLDKIKFNKNVLIL